MPQRSPVVQRVVFLDYLRIFAFVSVLVGHKFYAQLDALAADTGLPVVVRGAIEAFLPLCRGGATGVIVFFLVSGYIITQVLQKETVPAFAIKRIFRIYPLYVCAVLLETWASWEFFGTPLPPWQTMLPRLLLLGDFFDTPYALAGVEWTLRVEILFYAFMALLKAVHVLQRPGLLPVVFVGSALALHALPPFPQVAQWTYGYLTLYAPFLFIGALVYLLEHRLASRLACLAAMGFLFVQFLLRLPQLQPGWAGSHHGMYAMALFGCAWGLRGRLGGNVAVQLLSNLTYSVYLFHNWSWDYLLYSVLRLSTLGYSWPGIAPTLQVLFALFAGCYVSYMLIEQPGIRTGRALLRAGSRFRAASPGTSEGGHAPAPLACTDAAPSATITP